MLQINTVHHFFKSVATKAQRQRVCFFVMPDGLPVWRAVFIHVQRPMIANKKKVACLLVCLASVLLLANAFGQQNPSAFPAEEWVKKLSDKSDRGNNHYFQLALALSEKDTGFILSAIDQLESHVADNPYYNVRFLAFKLEITSYIKRGSRKADVEALAGKLLQEAYRSEDKHLISFANFVLGSTMFNRQELDLSLYYYLRAEEMNRTLKVAPLAQTRMWLQMGQVFFHTRAYESSITYTRLGLQGLSDTLPRNLWERVLYVNVVGQAYQRLGKLDSALAYYGQSMRLARLLDYRRTNDIWRGINAGHIGQVMFLQNKPDRAKQLLAYDYLVNRSAEPNVAAHSLQWLAKVNLAQGKKDSAVLHIRQAIGMLRASPLQTIQRINYLRDAYATATDVFRAANNADSVYHYAKLYTALHDEIEQKAYASSMNVLKTRLDNEKSRQTIENLQKDKAAEEQRMSFVLAVIVLISIICLLYLNWRRRRHQHKAQLALREKAAAEALARQQLELLTQNLKEKVNLLEELQCQLNNQQESAERQELMQSIASLTILTGDDWEKFQSLFVRLHPSFFMNLQEKVPDITPAEMRMAALSRLHLSTHQLAAILGVSLNSVYKTQQRLRQRLNLQAEDDVENTLLKL